jgi:hypothetical protein
MNKNKNIIIGVVVVTIGISIYYFVKKSNNKENPNLTIPQIFSSLYQYGAYLEKPDGSTRGFDINDLPFLNAWLDAAKNSKKTFNYNGIDYTTIGGKKVI